MFQILQNYILQKIIHDPLVYFYYTAKPKKIQPGKGVTGIPHRVAFAERCRRARMRVLFQSFSMVNHAS